MFVSCDSLLEPLVDIWGIALLFGGFVSLTSVFTFLHPCVQPHWMCSHHHRLSLPGKSRKTKAGRLRSEELNDERRRNVVSCDRTFISLHASHHSVQSTSKMSCGTTAWSLCPLHPVENVPAVLFKRCFSFQRRSGETSRIPAGVEDFKALICVLSHYLPV